MEWREVDDGLADFHMSIGVWTPFSTEGEWCCRPAMEIARVSYDVFRSVEEITQSVCTY